MLTLKPSSILQALVIAIYVAFIIFSPSLHFMPNFMFLHDSQRLLQLILLVFVLLNSMLIMQAPCNLMPIEKKSRCAFYILLILAGISSFLSQNPRHAMIEVSIFAALAYLSLFFASLYLKNKELFISRLMLGLWISITLYLFAFYVGYITACANRTPLDWPAPILGFNNVRSFNQYQLWGLGLAYLPLLTHDLKKKIRLSLNLLLVCWWIILFYSASRGVLVAWFVGIAITALIYRKVTMPFLRLQLIHIVAGFCAYLLLFKIAPHLIQMDLVAREIVRSSTNDRTELWEIAIDMTRNYPIFGAGPMHYPWFGPSKFHPHNSVLQLTSEWGLPATFIMLALAGYGVISWLERFNAKQIEANANIDRNFAILLFFTICTNAAYSLVDGVIVMPMSQVMMFTVIGIMIGQYCYGHVELAQTKPIKSKFKFRPIFAGIALMAITWSNLPELEKGLAGDERGFSLGADRINPRIWIQMVPPLKKEEIKNANS